MAGQQLGQQAGTHSDQQRATVPQGLGGRPSHRPPQPSYLQAMAVGRIHTSTPPPAGPQPDHGFSTPCVSDSLS